jgi:hypothetical protein
MTDMKLGVLAIVLAFAGSAASECAGELVGFTFSGYVVAVSDDPFQSGTQQFDTVTGHAVYDPDSVATDSLDGCVCLGYRQSIKGGLTATIGSMYFHADDYIVRVENKHDKDLGDYDLLTVTFSGGLSPPLKTAMYVNGVPYPNSLLDVILTASSDTFVDASLPRSLDLASFNSDNNVLDETYPTFGLLWKNTSLTAYTAGGGDYDKNGSVNADDYTFWRSNFGSTTAFDADGNGNGVVDAADYIVWRQHEGQSVSSASVPEPASCLIIASGLAALTFHRSRMD